MWLTENEFGDFEACDAEGRVKRAAEILGVSVIELFQLLRRRGPADVVGRASPRVLRRLEEAAVG